MPDASELGVTWGSDAETAALVKTFDSVLAWSQRGSAVRVLLGEFGVYYKARWNRARAGCRPWRASPRRTASPGPIGRWTRTSRAYDFDRDAWVAPVLKALVPSN